MKKWTIMLYDIGRLELLAHAQMCLAKLDELWNAAKIKAQLHAEREREEMDSKVESHVQQVEINKMALLELEKQLTVVS